MTSCRAFSDDLEAIAQRWNEVVCTSDKWTPEGPPGEAEGISAGFYVRSDGVRGFAKPSVHPNPRLGSPHVTNPVAAHEKIAADLAHRLGLPVPPAVLWDRGKRKDGSPHLCVISALAFAPAYKWSQVMRLPRAGVRMLPAISAAASAMVVYDTWMDNRDRINPGNLIVSEDGTTGLIRCAYIDFAQSMTFGWQDGPAPSILSQIGPYPGSVPVDLKAMTETLCKIESMDDAAISEPIQRIPTSFMTSQRKQVIINGLRQRRDQLRPVVEAKYGATS